MAGRKYKDGGGGSRGRGSGNGKGATDRRSAKEQAELKRIADAYRRGGESAAMAALYDDIEF